MSQYVSNPTHLDSYFAVHVSVVTISLRTFVYAATSETTKLRHLGPQCSDLTGKIHVTVKGGQSDITVKSCTNQVGKMHTG